MNRQDNTSVMNQQIFEMNLSVETVSIYLLCCNLTDTGQRLSSTNIRAIWNGTKDALETGIGNLLARNILTEVVSDRQDHTIYQLIDAEKWHMDLERS